MMNKAGVRLGAAIWLLAMTGFAALALTVLPQLAAQSPRNIPFAMVLLVSGVQSGVLLLLAVWAGVTLSRPLGLGAPMLEAVLGGTGWWSALRRQLLPATIVGLIVGAMLLLAEHMQPAPLAAAGQTVDIPLAARLLYGGVTEEVLLRWGLMTTLVWLPWRVLQKRAGLPRPAFVIGAIVAAAILFGAGHLPAAVAMGARLDGPVVTFIIVGNALPGILFGFLYWRKGIEAAMIAHALGHLAGFLAHTM
jgi:hypothetical protein